MIGKVTTWQMTPEELAAYRKKHPPQTNKKELKKKEGAFRIFTLMVIERKNDKSLIRCKNCI
jgi:hypothetical protein